MNVVCFHWLLLRDLGRYHWLTTMTWQNGSPAWTWHLGPHNAVWHALKGATWHQGVSGLTWHLGPRGNVSCRHGKRARFLLMWHFLMTWWVDRSSHIHPLGRCWLVKPNFVCWITSVVQPGLIRSIRVKLVWVYWFYYAHRSSLSPTLWSHLNRACPCFGSNLDGSTAHHTPVAARSKHLTCCTRQQN